MDDSLRGRNETCKALWSRVHGIGDEDGEPGVGDELWMSIKSGNVFYGFQELPIVFPPTYRRARDVSGASPNLSDKTELYHAFTTVVEKRSSMMLVAEKAQKRLSIGTNMPRGDTKPVPHETASPLVADEEYHQAVSEGKSAVGKSTKTSRVPSYTDRIVVHSLPDRGELMKLLQVHEHRCFSFIPDHSFFCSTCRAVAAVKWLSKPPKKQSFLGERKL